METQTYTQSASATFCNYFFRNKVFKNSTLIVVRVGGGGEWEGAVDPTLIFLEVGLGKTKPKRWVEMCPKMRNLHRCHCLENFSKCDITAKTYRLGSNVLPSPSSLLSSHRVKMKTSKNISIEWKNATKLRNKKKKQWIILMWFTLYAKNNLLILKLHIEKIKE